MKNQSWDADNSRREDSGEIGFWSTFIHGKAWKAGRYPLLSILAFLYLVPVIVLIMTSFKTQIQIMSRGPSWIFMPTLANYRNVLMEQGFLRYLINSLIVGSVSTFFTLIIGGFASYALVRFNFFGEEPSPSAPFFCG